MKKHLVVLFFLIGFAISGYSKNNLDKVVFGNYGGFANMKTSFVLYKDGTIFKIDPKTLMEIAIKKLSKCKTKKIFKKVNKIKSLNISQPGNINYFINCYQKDNVSNNVWSSHSANPKLEKIYRLLIGLAVLK